MCGKMELNAYRDVVLTLSMVNPIAVVCVVPIFVLCQDPRKPPSERGDLMGGSVMVKRRSGLLLYISLKDDRDRHSSTELEKATLAP